MPRWTLITLSLIALSLATATGAPSALAIERDLRHAAATISDPVAQDRMADTVTALVAALMQVNVGPLAEAVAHIDPESDAAYIPPDATLGEIAGGDAYLAERMGDDVRASARMAGHAASAIAIYAPVLKDMARDLAAQWDRERDAARR